MKKSRECLDAWKSAWDSIQLGMTKAQYLALMSSWCVSEVYLNGPDFILRILHELSVEDKSGDSQRVEGFLQEADRKAVDLDAEQSNSILNVCAAVLFHVETLAEFTSFDDCLFTIRASITPGVVASVFLGGVCLWFSMRVIRLRGGSNPAAEQRVISRFSKALSSISWGPQPLSCTDDGFLTLLGNLLEQTQVWGTHIHFKI
jgi:hypothetical protein